MTGPLTQWVEPKLVVLTRNNPEEAVLETCKVPSGGAGSSDRWRGCFVNEDCSGLCDADHPS